MPRRAGTTIKTTEVKKEDSGVNISDVLSLLQEIKKENDQLKEEERVNDMMKETKNTRNNEFRNTIVFYRR